MRTSWVRRHPARVFVRLLAEAATKGLVRTDVSSEELTDYCLHALPAAGQAADLDQVGRLVRVVLDGLGCSVDVHETDQISSPSHDVAPSRKPD